VVEHYLHTVGVAGSKPAARTTPKPAISLQTLAFPPLPATGHTAPNRAKPRLPGQKLSEMSDQPEIHGTAAAELTVTIVEHPAGFLMRLEHDGSAMTLDRAEAFDLHEKLSAKLGEMPVKL
jgi:hypothetical protein